MGVQECCHCCNIGIMAHEAGLPCSLMVRFGAHCDAAFRECCDNGRRLPPPTTSSLSSSTLSSSSSSSLLSNTSFDSEMRRTARLPPAPTTTPSSLLQGHDASVNFSKVQQFEKLTLFTAVRGNPVQSYGASPAIWDHTRVNAVRFGPRQASNRSFTHGESSSSSG